MKRIKRFVVEDTGLKIPHDEKDAGTFHDFVFKKQFGFNVPVPLFTLVLIKKNGELFVLGTLNIIFTKVNENIEFDYSFTSNLPDGIEEYKLNVKDILNIRSEINTIPKGERVLNYVNKRNYEIDNVEEQFFTYLATILIELDPL